MPKVTLDPTNTAAQGANAQIDTDISKSLGKQDTEIKSLNKEIAGLKDQLGVLNKEYGIKTKKSKLRESYTLGENQRKSLNVVLEKAKVNKSMNAGYNVDPNTMTDGAALQLQSLDGLIRNTTYSSRDLTILKQLFNQSVRHVDNTVGQYNLFTAHGSSGFELFRPEIGIAEDDTPRLKRVTLHMKYVVPTRTSSFVALNTNSVENPDLLNEQDAALAAANAIESGCWWGDSDLSSQSGESNGLEFDGLAKMIDEDNVLDNRGKGLTNSVLSQAVTTIGYGFSHATDAYMPLGVLADYSNLRSGHNEINMMPTQANTASGTVVSTYYGVNSAVTMHGSNLMMMSRILDEKASVKTAAPTQPTATAEVVAKQNGQFATEAMRKTEQESAYEERTEMPAEVGSTLSYKVVAVDSHGASMPSIPVTAKVANADDGVKITIDPLPGAQKPEYYAIYRRELTDKNKDGSDDHAKYYLITRIGTNKANDEEQVEFTDINDTIPGTGDVFIGEMTEYSIAMYEFFPLTRYDLAITTDARSFFLFWSGALALMRPKSWVRIKNVRTNEHTPAGASYISPVYAPQVH